jgi:hypothetical protein
MASYLPSSGSSKLSPDEVVQMLFYFQDQAHFNHLQTNSFARHKALDGLYQGLQGFRDEISELLLGYIAPKRFTETPRLPVNKAMTDEKLLDMLCLFADKLYDYGEETKWWALSNQAAELSGLGYKTKYLITLS